MRGRTNADTGNGVILNATTDTYEVASGESILAGDFVEQYQYIIGHLDDAEVDDDNDYQPYFRSPLMWKVGNDKYACKNKLYSKNNLDEYIVEATLSASMPTQQYIEDLGNNRFIGLEITKNNNNHLICEYVISEFSNNDLTSNSYTATIQTGTSAKSDIRFQIIKRPSAGWFFACSYVSSSTAYTICGYMSLSDTTLSVSDVQSPFEIGNFLYASRMSENSDNYIIQGDKANADNAKKFTNTTLASLSRLTQPTGSFSDVNVYLGNPYNFNDNIDLFYITGTPSTGRSLMRKRIRYNYSEGTYAQYDPETVIDGLGTNVYVLRYIGKLNSKDMYILRPARASDGKSYIIPFTVNVSTREIETSQAIELEENLSSGYTNLITSSFYDNNILMIFGRELSTDYHMLVSFNYVNGDYIDESGEVKQVRGITTQKYIKGVAKQSGTAGDSIEVYIPQVNS